MSDLYVTRFTDTTWSENQKYCEVKVPQNSNKIIYNSPIMISKNVPYNVDLLVLEMNNSTNKIMGLSIVKNRVKGSHTHKMYNDNNYNRYSYVGRERISVESMNISEKQVIMFLEQICFKGKTHIKRGQGMSKINECLFIKCREILDVPLFIKNMFDRRQKNSCQIQTRVILHTNGKRDLCEMENNDNNNHDKITK